MKTLTIITAIALGAIAAAPAAASNLVVNGGFETADLQGWMTSGGITSVSTLPGFAHSGGAGALLAASSYSALGQAVPTVAGQTYALSFWLRNIPHPSEPQDNRMLVSAGNSILLDLNHAAPFDWTGFNYQFVAESSATWFGYFYYNGPAAWVLDDVSIEAVTAPPIGGVPEPGTWAMLVAGFGAVGAASRKRRAARPTQERKPPFLQAWRWRPLHP